MDKNKTDWTNIVGSKEFENGGMIGDLAQVILSVLNQAKSNGQLKESDVGQVLSQALVQAISVIPSYELERQKTKSSIEIQEKQLKLQEKESINKIAISKSELDLKTRDEASVIANREIDNKLKLFQLEKEKELLALEKEKFDLEKEKTLKTIKSLDAEIELKREQVNNAKNENELKKQQLAIAKEELKVKKETLKYEKEKIKLEKDKLKAEKDRIEESILEIKNKIDSTMKRTLAEVRLLHSQAKAFRDNSKQQLLKTSIDGYSMLFENTEDLQGSDALPNLFKSKGIDKVAKNMFESYGIDSGNIFN